MDKKPTLLERYWKTRLEFETCCKEIMPSPEQLWGFQELVYRIGVLEVFQLFAKAAPLTGEMNILFLHYQAVSGYIEHLRSERFCASLDPKRQKQQQTARASLDAVIEDYRKRYASYAPKGPEQYRKDIANTIAAVLPAWVQYRDTVVGIKINTEEAPE